MSGGPKPLFFYFGKILLAKFFFFLGPGGALAPFALYLGPSLKGNLEARPWVASLAFLKKQQKSSKQKRARQIVYVFNDGGNDPMWSD